MPQGDLLHDAEDREAASGRDNRVTVLAVIGLASDRVALETILRHSSWVLRWAGTSREAIEILQSKQTGVVLCAPRLPDGDWKDLLREAALLPAPPSVIVLSACPEDSLWAEVLNLGGYDVLCRPLTAGEVVRVVSMAWRRWQHMRDRSAPRVLRAFGRA